MFTTGLDISSPTTQELAVLNIDHTTSPAPIPCAQKQKPNTPFEVICMQYLIITFSYFNILQKVKIQLQSLVSKGKMTSKSVMLAREAARTHGTSLFM